jgi:hypothetical protein
LPGSVLELCQQHAKTKTVNIERITDFRGLPRGQ